MANCDLCNTEMATGKRYSASQIQAAARAGLRPGGGAASVGQMLGLGDDAWLNMVMSDTTDWSLCSSCAAKADPYLATGE